MFATLSIGVQFLILSLASARIGILFTRFKLPMITGFLLTGMLVGPYILGMLTPKIVQRLRFIDDISLAIIAFAAGSELYLKELRGRFRSIFLITGMQVLCSFCLGGLAIFLMSEWIPFLRTMPIPARVAVCALAGAILVARSPSSTIAVINEMRAKGPFTQTILGVTMITDVVVIVLFATSLSLSSALMSGKSFEGLRLLTQIALQIFISFGLGAVLGWIIGKILGSSLHRFLKRSLILFLGYGVFVLETQIHHAGPKFLPFAFDLEPLLVCMVAGFYVTNFSRYRLEFHEALHKLVPAIFVAFFTLTGASLVLDVLLKNWPIALVFVFLRGVTIFFGTWAGGSLSGDPTLHNRIGWMSYITQAGVSLGLAKSVSIYYPGWGGDFATLMISMIVVNQIAGPPFFKWALQRVGEAHVKGEGSAFDGQHDAMIFGLDVQTVALAKQLQRHGWNAHIATLDALDDELEHSLVSEGIKVFHVEALQPEALRSIGTQRMDAVVAMLSDEENFLLCELAYEHFGTKNLVVLLHARENFDQFHELGALIVDPNTAMVSLFDHFVRSPLGTSFLLGLDQSQDVVDFVLRDPELHGVSLRDLTLPSDVLVLSVYHKGRKLVSHGHTRLEIGDRITVVGSPESLEKLGVMFELVGSMSAS